MTVLADAIRAGCLWATCQYPDCDQNTACGNHVACLMDFARHLAAHPAEEQIEAMAIADYESTAGAKGDWARIGDTEKAIWRRGYRAVLTAYWARVLGESDFGPDFRG